MTPTLDQERVPRSGPDNKQRAGKRLTFRRARLIGRSRLI
jgi:hypothetical protein